MATRAIPAAKTLPKPGASPKPAVARRKTASKPDVVAKPATARRKAATRPAPRPTSATQQAAVDPAVGSALVGQLARPVTAMFLAIPLLAAVLGAGELARLITLSGATALFLAVDVLFERIGHPTRPARSLAVSMVAWLAGLALLGNAGQIDFRPYHGEAPTLVGVIAAAYVATVCPRPTAVLWSLAAAGAVGLGASLAGSPSPGMAMAVCSIAFGAVGGLLLGTSLDGRLVGRPAVAVSKEESALLREPLPKQR